MQNPFKKLFGKKAAPANEQGEQRGITMMDKATGLPIEFSLWADKQGFTFSKKTPLLENIYDTIASEFSKIELILVDDKIQMVDGKKERVYLEREHDPHYDILSLRPNMLQSKSELLYTIAYQLHRYRNALVRIVRDVDADRNTVLALEPINCADYLFGQGYEYDGDLYLKLLDKKTGRIVLLDYSDVIHLRLNPNDVFYGDKNDGFDLNNFVRVFDENLSTMLKKLKDSGVVRGIVEMGGGGFAGGFNAAMSAQQDKISKQDEISERVAKAKDGIVVFDGGEKFHAIRDTFKTMATDEVDNMMKYLFSFKGINQAVIDGTATEEQMGIFFNKTIKPIVIRFLEELTYKFLTKTARTQGQKIKAFRNAFEYTTIKELLSNLYLGAMFFSKNEIRDKVFGFAPREGGDELLDNKNFGNLHGMQKGGEINE